MGLVSKAKQEFQLLGWENSDDEMQKLACENVIELLETFSKQGHSGFSAMYILDIFEKLVRHEPLTALTGSEEEWEDLSSFGSPEPVFQNRRFSEVFKRQDGSSYWIHGKVFRLPDGTTYTNKNSCVDITFPWTKAKPEIVDVTE